jgi:choline dehydrogenase
MTSTAVTQIILDRKQVRGVRAVSGSKSLQFRAREVILAAGAINSPQLLLLSGIGPAMHLRDVGIPLHHDLPGVGQHLLDHPACAVVAKVNTSTVDISLRSTILAGLQWAIDGRGPLMCVGAQALAFVRSHSALALPDVQLHMMPMAYERDAKARVRFRSSSISLLFNVSRPRSQGVVELRSRAAGDPPAIYPNLLGDSADIETLTRAGRLCRQLLNTSTLGRYVKAEIAPGQAIRGDSQWENFLRENSSTAYHYCGTCKMGADKMAVVDPRLRVHGVEGLRVVDASIMPTIPSGNTSASTFMIAEKGAQMILADESGCNV